MTTPISPAFQTSITERTDKETQLDQTLQIQELETSLAELRAREERLIFALAGSSDGIWDLNIPTQKIQFSKRWKEILGYQEDDIGDNLSEWYDLVHPEDLPATLANIREHLEGKTRNSSCEYRLLDKERNYRWILGNGMVIERDLFGQPLRMIGTHSDISAYKLTELKLQAATESTQQVLDNLRMTEESFAFALEGNGDGIWDWDIATGKVQLSSRWKSMLGYAEHEIGNDLTEWSSRVHPDDVPQVMAEVTAHLDSRTNSFSSEHRVRCKDGTYKWILDRGKVVKRDAEGKPLRMVGTHTDITHDRITVQALETALRDNSALLTALNMHALVSVTDQAGNITDVNEAFCHISGYERNELIGKNHRIINSGIQSQRFWEKMWEEIESGKPWHGQICNRAKNGSFYWVDTFIAPFMEADGTIDKYISIRTDITTAKMQEAELISTRDQLKRATDVAELAIWTWNIEENTLIWDERMYSIYEVPRSYSNSHLPYEQWRSRVHPDDIAYTEEQLFGAVAGLNTFDPTFRIVNNAGSVHFIQATGVVERDKNGKATHVIGVNRDVTLQHNVQETLREAKEAADESNQAKSAFLANMSHELRTPMNAILGMLSLLRKTELSPRQADYVAKTDGAARSLLSLLNDILDISKAEAGKMQLDPIAFNISQLVRDLSVILSTNLTSKPVELIFNIAPDVPHYLIGDAMRLQQVLINLGGNAIKFTEQGDVTLTLTLENRINNIAILKFSVKDTGIGIARENHTKIFSGFTQAESSTTRRFGGTGLGLAISQQLVSLMGGKLELESNIGEGSHFFFRIALPLLDDAGVANLNVQIEGNENINSDQAQLKNMRLLVVEDNLNNQQIALELLEAEGAIVTIANNGQEAVELLLKELGAKGMPNIDVVLMDLQMPVMDGFIATHKIRTELKLLTLPIVAMTANVMTTDREACLTVGMNEHLGKPFDIRHLVKVLRIQAGWEIAEQPNAETQVIMPVASNYAANAAGVDFTAALSRLGGKRELYLRMLPMFLTNLAGIPAQLHDHLAQKDWVLASRLLHSLKGLSATLGVTTLADQAAIGEKTLANCTSSSEAELIIEGMCTEIDTVQPSLIHFLDVLQKESAQN